MDIHCISTNIFRGNYSFLNLTLCTVTFVHSTYKCGNYSREETIQGRKLFAEIRYMKKVMIKMYVNKKTGGVFVLCTFVAIKSYAISPLTGSTFDEFIDCTLV